MAVSRLLAVGPPQRRRRSWPRTAAPHPTRRGRQGCGTRRRPEVGSRDRRGSSASSPRPCERLSVVADEPHAGEWLAHCEPLLLLYHPRAPDEVGARRECEAVKRLLLGRGPTGLLVEIAKPIPPPPFTALRHYRRLIDEAQQVEAVAVVVSPDHGFAASIGLAVVRQLFTSLDSATPCRPSPGSSLPRSGWASAWIGASISRRCARPWRGCTRPVRLEPRSTPREARGAGAVSRSSPPLASLPPS